MATLEDWALVRAVKDENLGEVKSLISDRPFTQETLAKALQLTTNEKIQVWLLERGVVNYDRIALLMQAAQGSSPKGHLLRHLLDRIVYTEDQINLAWRLVPLDHSKKHKALQQAIRNCSREVFNSDLQRDLRRELVEKTQDQLVERLRTEDRVEVAKTIVQFLNPLDYHRTTEVIGRALVEADLRNHSALAEYYRRHRELYQRTYHICLNRDVFVPAAELGNERLFREFFGRAPLKYRLQELAHYQDPRWPNSTIVALIYQSRLHEPTDRDTQ